MVFRYFVSRVDQHKAPNKEGGKTKPPNATKNKIRRKGPKPPHTTKRNQRKGKQNETTAHDQNQVKTRRTKTNATRTTNTKRGPKLRTNDTTAAQDAQDQNQHRREAPNKGKIKRNHRTRPRPNAKDQHRTRTSRMG